MVDSITRSPESAHDWSLLDGVPSGEWKNDRKRLFILYVEHEKGIKKYGAVRRACAKFSVAEPTYYYWLKNVSTQENGNGNETIETHGSTPEASAPSPAKTIENHQAVLVARLRAAYAEADAAAMELKDTLTDALLMTLAARIDELERIHGVIRPAAAVEEPAKRVAAEISTLLTADGNGNGKPAAAEPETPPSPPVPAVETPAPIPAPAPAPAVVHPVPATPAAAQKPPEKPSLTPKDRAILVMQATLGVASAKYERMVDLTVEEAMRRHAAAFPNAGWTEKNAYENGARDLLTAYDPAKDGHPLHYIERRTMMKHAPREAAARIADLGRMHNPKAFEMARRWSKRDGLPKGVDHDFLKTEAYRTMGMLASMYDEEEFGDFWIWAEPLVAKALDAACGEEAMSFLNVKAKARADERQKTVGELLSGQALGAQLAVREKPDDGPRHRAMIQLINGLVTGGTVSTMKEVLETLMRSYMDDMTALAAQLHDENFRETLDECLLLVMRSMLKSAWLFNPRRRGNLDDYIRTGWTLLVRESR